jgi:hypothetical protein
VVYDLNDILVETDELPPRPYPIGALILEGICRPCNKNKADSQELIEKGARF